MLDSTANGWTYEATPVALSGTAPTPLRVELTYACTRAGVIDDRPAVAMLSWEGPGLAKQLVPSAALTTPDGSQQGLQGEYVLQAQGAETRVTRVDPQVNFIWFHQCFVASARDELRRRLAAQFYAVARSASTLAAWEQNAQANPEAVLVRGRTREAVRMVELPTQQARPLLRRFPVLVPTGHPLRSAR